MPELVAVPLVEAGATEIGAGAIAAGAGSAMVAGAGTAVFGAGAAAATGFTLANAASAANIIGAGVSAYSALTTKKTAAPQLPGAPPAAPPTMQSPTIDAAIMMQQRKASMAGGIMSNIGTTPQGTMMAPQTTEHTLLGQ